MIWTREVYEAARFDLRLRESDRECRAGAAWRDARARAWRGRPVAFPFLRRTERKDYIYKHAQEFVKQNDKIDLNEEQMLRLSYLLNIYEVIQQKFNNPDNKERYMSLKNHNKPFQGKTPLEYILEGSIDRLEETYQHLASWLV